MTNITKGHSYFTLLQLPINISGVLQMLNPAVKKTVKNGVLNCKKVFWALENSQI